MTHVVVDLEGTRHLVAEAGEGVGDVIVRAKIRPSSAVAVAANSQGIASEEQQQAARPRRE